MMGADQVSALLACPRAQRCRGLNIWVPDPVTLVDVLRIGLWHAQGSGEMQAIQVSRVAKSFGKTQAVVDVSLDVERGEILGLLGPNGAGKTTTIRLMLDIFRLDRGTVSVLDGPMTEEKKDHIGYTPEERGLYQDIPLERCLLYLASLKSMPLAGTRVRLDALLERVDLTAPKGKKVKELSNGRQQKAQLINTIIHPLELVIIDEPFAALDPVNTRLVKDLTCELREQGVAILMSTHQMHQVEEICDRNVLIDHGRDVLYGNLDEIRRRYSGHAVLVRAADELPSLPGIERVASHNNAVKLDLAEGMTPQDVLAALMARGALIEKFEVALPTLDEVFMRAAGAMPSDGSRGDGAAGSPRVPGEGDA
jgi:ABC-2 type transport system ATP-binding protein